MENLRGHKPISSDSEAFIKHIKIIVLPVTPHEYYMLLPALIISAAFEPMVRPSVQSRRFTLARIWQYNYEQSWNVLF